MEAKNSDHRLNECEIAWLTVEKDLNAKLQTPESLKYALQCSGRNPSEKAINQYWSKFEGSISFDQFSTIMHSEKRTTMADLMKAFRKIDLNGDGFISHDELYKTLTKRGEKLTHEEVQAIIDEADYNKDGKLDYAEFCHILLSTATECQSLSNKKASKTLNKTVHTSSSKKTTSIPNTNGVLTSSQIDRSLPPQDDRISLSSKTRVQQQLMKTSHQRDSVPNGSAVKKYNKSDRSTGDHSNAATHNGPVTNSVQTVHNGTSLVKGDQTKMAASEDVKVKNKVSTADSESDKEVEEELDESSNLGDSILQQLPLSSTPATDHSSATNNKPEQKTSQLFGSKLPPIGKSNLPPLTLSLPTTDIPPITTSTAINPATSSTTTITQSTTTSSSSIEVSSTVADTNTEGPAANRTSLVRQEGGSDVTKVVKDGEEGVSGQGDDKESSHDGLVTVTPLNHTLSSELSGTLSDDSVAVTPTESIDITESDTDDGHNDKTVQELPQPIQPDHLQQQQEDKKTSIATTTESSTVATLTTSTTTTTAATTTVKQVAETNKKQSPTSAVYQKPPKVPSNLESWYTISGKGCFYIKRLEGSHISDELSYHIVSQQYGLHLPQPSCVFVEIQVVPPGDELFDVALFLFKSDSTNETATDFITFTEHQIDKKFVCKLDLEAGNYTMVPFTGGCRLKPCDDDESHDPVSLLTPDSSKLTEECVKVLMEIFHRIDLDDNGFISRQEFDLFQEHTSGEVCDDDAWQVIQVNFDQNSDDEITVKGFLDLHLMTAQDTSGGKEAELLIILQSMGYNNQLILDEACPFSLDVHADTCEGEIIVMETQPFASLINPVLCQLATMRGVAKPVRGGAEDQVMLYTYTSLYHATIVIENKPQSLSSPLLLPPHLTPKFHCNGTALNLHAG
ncbi:EF-hand calcium-binding domain-containing protein 7-like isoform X2 [Dysidea avara]|uniref:EF-hand calcium-binding domain-containing protein 7-like isoform X2 n=1 Tax=Dysidea avara TaxID=196820 RepID=UPI00331A2A74